MTDLTVSKKKDFFFDLTVYQLMGYSRLFTPTIAKKNTNMREAVIHSQRLSITLRYLATGNNFEDLKFIRLLLSQLELLCRRVFTAWQTNGQ
jgi:hypothetical protein